MAGSFLVNGEAVTAIEPDDRGLAYGDGLFETIAVRHSKPLRWHAHLERLAEGAAQLGIASPVADAWESDAARLLSAASQERQVLKLTLTRGGGGRGYAPHSASTPTRVAQLTDWPAWPASHAETGVVVRVCNIRLGINPALAGLKHLNRLEQVLAARETLEAGVDEGLMLDSDGRLVEGVRTNLLLVVDGTLVAPTLSRCGVRGVMREMLLTGARALGIPTLETDCEPALLARASEVLLCNSLIGIWPVRAVQGLPNTALAPGAVTRRLQAWLAEADDAA